MDWYRSETWKAYERPESEVTGNKADDYERRDPGTAGMIQGVRYQVYEADGRPLRAVHGVGAGPLEELLRGGRPRRPVRAVAGFEVRRPRRGNLELRAELRDIFRTRTAAEWIDFGIEKNFPVAPVNSPKTIADDPQFQDRFQWYPVDQLGAEQLGSPIKFIGEEMPVPAHAPTVGQHTEEVLADCSAGTPPRSRSPAPGADSGVRRRVTDPLPVDGTR